MHVHVQIFGSSPFQTATTSYKTNNNKLFSYNRPSIDNAEKKHTIDECERIDAFGSMRLFSFSNLGEFKCVQLRVLYIHTWNSKWYVRCPVRPCLVDIFRLKFSFVDRKDFQIILWDVARFEYLLYGWNDSPSSSCVGFDFKFYWMFIYQSLFEWETGNSIYIILPASSWIKRTVVLGDFNAIGQPSSIHTKLTPATTVFNWHLSQLTK